MQRARTAREAVEIIGALIDAHGYSTYGGNSHMFADQNEGWVLIEFAGGRGLWIAERLGTDEVRMSYPGYIGEIPLDFRSRDDFMGSANFISFAVEQGWYDPAAGKPFDVNAVYSAGREKQPRSAMEQELRDAAPIDLRSRWVTHCLAASRRARSCLMPESSRCSGRRSPGRLAPRSLFRGLFVHDLAVKDRQSYARVVNTLWFAPFSQCNDVLADRDDVGRLSGLDRAQPVRMAEKPRAVARKMRRWPSKYRSAFARSQSPNWRSQT